MSHLDHGAVGWSPALFTVIILVVALVYLRGWLRLRTTSSDLIPPWRAASFLLGLVSIWVAWASPLAALDHQWLTVHMIQHLLLMTCASPLILLGAPLMAWSRGLPQPFLETVVDPVFRWAPVQRFGSALAQPACCWLAATAALMGWHLPAAFAVGLQSGTWHGVEHASFLAGGLLFWWPVIQPWPSVPTGPRWWMVVYLFLATLPCDVLSGFLVFSERITYPVYLTTSQRSGLSVLEDQQAAGALMWTCVTIVYLVVGTMLTTRLLSSQSSTEGVLVHAESPRPAVVHGDPRSAV